MTNNLKHIIMPDGTKLDLPTGVNNVYSYGISQYYKGVMNNNSWLRSAGQWNSGAVYNGVYDWAVAQQVAGVDGFKLSTEEYTDYDWVLNTTDGTFRLPLKNGSEDLPSNKYENLTLSNNDSSYTAPANGYYTLSKGGDVGTYIQYASNNKGDRAYSSSTNSDIWLSSKLLKEGDTITWSYTASGTTNLFRFVYAQGNGNLYYYIGDVLENADLINIARLQEALADKTNTVQASLASAPSNVYDDLTLLASGQTYVAPETGWFFLDKIAGSAGAYVAITNSTTDLGAINDGYSATRACKTMLKVAKGDTVKVEYTATGNTRFFRFYYDVGVKSNKAS